MLFSLPLSRDGPDPIKPTSDDDLLRHFLDVHISSGPSSCSTLKRFLHLSIPDTLGKPSTLLVSCPDVFLPGAMAETQVVQLAVLQVTGD